MDEQQCPQTAKTEAYFGTISRLCVLLTKDVNCAFITMVNTISCVAHVVKNTLKNEDPISLPYNWLREIMGI